MMKLTIVPLCAKDCMGANAKERITTAGRLFLQTAEHPFAKWIKDEGLAFVSMDDLYASCGDFDELNDAVAKRLFESDCDAVYAAPGRGPGAAALKAIMTEAGAKGAYVERLPGTGYAEAALCASGVAASDVRTLEATALPKRLDPYVTTVVEEIDTVSRAGEVKLALAEYFPDEYDIFFCYTDDGGGYASKRIRLYELDRQSEYFATTVAIIPEATFDALERHGIEGLLSVMERLRAPGGCPWDAEQTHESLKKSLVEETYEVLDAIDRGDNDALEEELGDVLLQVVFHTELEREKREFTMRDVCTGIVNKLVYRHPHVFGDTSVKNADEVLVNWEALKKKEKQQRSVTEAMESVPRGFPALMRAQKLQKKAAGVGFDWPDVAGALDKLSEEAGELTEAINGGEGEPRVNEEAGDLLFSAVNAVRLAGCDAELCLAAATDKFFNRFSIMEEGALAEGADLSKMDMNELDARWERAKLK